MPITEKEALGVFGVEDLSQYETADAFKEAIEEKWTPLDRAHDRPEVRERVIGKVNRVGRTRLQNLAEEVGIEVDAEVFKKDPLDIIPAIGAALKPRLEEMGKWKEKAEKAVPDDVIKEWEGKLGAKDKELLAFKKQAEEFSAKYNDLHGAVTKKERDGKIGGAWEKGLAAVEFAPNTPDLVKTGFVAKVKEKYQVALDDDGNDFLADVQGNPVAHPTKAGQRWSLAEALKEEAKAHKLIATNPHGNKPVNQPKPATFGGASRNTDPKERRTFIAEPMKVMGR